MNLIETWEKNIDLEPDGENFLVDTSENIAINQPINNQFDNTTMDNSNYRKGNSANSDIKEKIRGRKRTRGAMR